MNYKKKKFFLIKTFSKIKKYSIPSKSLKIQFPTIYWLLFQEIKFEQFTKFNLDVTIVWTPTYNEVTNILYSYKAKLAAWLKLKKLTFRTENPKLNK